jgi:hypothetical protein
MHGALEPLFGNQAKQAVVSIETSINKSEQESLRAKTR